MYYSVTTYNRGQLDKVDQLDDQKITTHSKKVSCQSLLQWSEIDNMGQTQPIIIYRHDLLNPLTKAYVSWEVRLSVDRGKKCKR